MYFSHVLTDGCLDNVYTAQQTVTTGDSLVRALTQILRKFLRFSFKSFYRCAFITNSEHNKHTRAHLTKVSDPHLYKLASY